MIVVYIIIIIIVTIIMEFYLHFIRYQGFPSHSSCTLKALWPVQN
jgi:hypothetical protein